MSLYGLHVHNSGVLEHTLPDERQIASNIL